MSEAVGRHVGLDNGPQLVTRSPLLKTPVPVSPSNLRTWGSSYAKQAIQPLDRMGNAASLVRQANGGYRTIYRAINVDVSAGTLVKIRLPNNVGGGAMTYSKLTGFTPPSGYLKLCDDYAPGSTLMILSPGATIDVAPGVHQVKVQAVTPSIDARVIVRYAMEVYIANIVFAAQPAVGDILRFGAYAVFEFVDGGAVTVPGYYPVEIGADAAAAITNFIAAFNTAYVASIPPAGSYSPFHFARPIDAADLVTYNSGSTWVTATTEGCQVVSIEAPMIRDCECGNQAVQIFLHL